MISVTAESIRGVYVMLSKMMPFKRWAVAPVEQVLFVATNSKEVYGEYTPDDDDFHIIRISGAKHGHLDTMIKTVAHEMIHMVLYRRRNKEWAEHDATFSAMAEQVCKYLGYDPREL